MRLILIVLIVLLLPSCANHTREEQMKDTGTAIIKALSAHDSSALNKLFVHDPALEPNEIKHRNENIEDGYMLCSGFSAVDTSQYKIRIEPISKTVYEALVDISFLNKTGETRGKITLHFANWWGFKKADNIDVVNFDEIDKAYQEHVHDGLSDSLAMEGAKVIMKANHIRIQSH